MAVKKVSDLMKTTRKIEDTPTLQRNPYIKTKPFEPYPESTNISPPWYIDESKKPIEPFEKGQPSSLEYDTKPITENESGEPWYIDQNKKPYSDQNTSSGDLWYKDSDMKPYTESGGSGTPWYGEKDRKKVDGESTAGGLWYAEKENRKIQSFPTGKIAHKYRRKIQKFTHTYDLKAKNKKKYTKPKYITNSKSTKKSQQRFSVRSGKDFVDKHKKVDKLMRFHLNMTYGTSYGNTAKYFDRLYSIYPEKEMDGLCQYVFIVRPDLNILSTPNDLLKISKSEMNKKGYLQNVSPHDDPLFQYMLQKYPNMLRSLTNHLEGGNHDFIPFLVGRTESLQIPDYSIKNYKMNQPYTNYQLPYASNALESATGGEFDIVFREDNEFRIHKLFQTWLYYIDGVTRNRFGPKMKYVTHNKIDYACSVYNITCLRDAETIVYWSKYTGAFPTSVPNSDTSFQLRGDPNKTITIPFSYFYQESLNPYILLDFNKNSHVTKPNKTAYIPIYRSATLNDIGMKDYRDSSNKDITSHSINAKTKFRKSAPVALGSGNGLVGAPFICTVKDTNGWHYALRWKSIKDISGK